MSDYFDYTTGRLTDGVTARAPVVNVILDEISAGFDMLPSVNHTKLGQVQYGTDSGAANAYVVTLPYAPSAYSDGMVIAFKAAASNSGASTINVNGLGVIDITRQSGAALEAQDIVAGRFTVCRYNSTTGNAEITSMVSDIAVQGIIDSFSALTAASGVMVSANDSTVGYLEGKLLADSGLSFSTQNDGANETRTIKPVFQRSERTSNVALAASDRGKLVDITSGTFTQTITAAATLGDGWFCYYRNSGTGLITFNANIDGVEIIYIYPKETRLIQCTGAAFFSVVLTSFSLEFPITNTFSKPPGYHSFYCSGVSGGGSGANAGASGNAAGGGGGGGRFDMLIPASAFASTITVTIGDGGGAQSTDHTAGNDGGSTSIGTLMVVTGGGGGRIASASTATTGGDGGGLTGISVDTDAQDGFGGLAGFTTVRTAVYGGANGGYASLNTGVNPGNASVFGGGGGGSVSYGTPAASIGGTSAYAGAGGAASVDGNGTAGSVPGGGGGATSTGTSSGAGGKGWARIIGVL